MKRDVTSLTYHSVEADVVLVPRTHVPFSLWCDSLTEKK